MQRSWCLKWFLKGLSRMLWLIIYLWMTSAISTWNDFWRDYGVVFWYLCKMRWQWCFSELSIIHDIYLSFVTLYVFSSLCQKYGGLHLSRKTNPLPNWFLFDVLIFFSPFLQIFCLLWISLVEGNEKAEKLVHKKI